MAASFNHRGMELTTFPRPAEPADYTNVAPMGQNSLQTQHVPRHRQKPLGGEHKTMGVVQIMLGIIQLTFGFALYYNDSCPGSIGISWCTGVWYIISGALSVLVEKGTKKALLVGNLVMNILSTVAAGVGIAIYGILLGTGPVCSAHFPASWHFIGTFQILVLWLLVFTLFEFVISLTTSSYSCAALRCCEMDYEVNTTVIQSAAAQNSPAREPQDENYETLLAGHSTYETLNFKG